MTNWRMQGASSRNEPTISGDAEQSIGDQFEDVKGFSLLLLSDVDALYIALNRRREERG
jgi:hypothetical protein